MNHGKGKTDSVLGVDPLSADELNSYTMDELLEIVASALDSLRGDEAAISPSANLT